MLRKGRGWRAGVVRAASAFSFTHIGILAADDHGGWVVIHAAPPGSPLDGRVRSEPLMRFAATDQASDIAFWRVSEDSALTARMVSAARTELERQTPFDNGFDFADHRELYCTELVWVALKRAGHPIPLRFTHIAAGPVVGDFMTPHDLLVAGNFKPLERDEP